MVYGPAYGSRSLQASGPLGEQVSLRGTLLAFRSAAGPEHGGQAVLGHHIVRRAQLFGLGIHEGTIAGSGMSHHRELAAIDDQAGAVDE